IFALSCSHDRLGRCPAGPGYVILADFIGSAKTDIVPIVMLCKRAPESPLFFLAVLLLSL
ncbi:MAG: hypothetical protein AB2531_14535, partial [Candidatus Thiodiazotropha sp.]